MNSIFINFPEKLKNKKFVLIIFLIFGYLWYLNSFNNQFFWDDHDNFVKNQFVHQFEVGKFFTENLVAGAGFVSNYWRPMLALGYAIQWQLFGNFPPAWHFVHTGLHILNGFLLFLILQKIFRFRLLCFLTALIFIIHPVQTEAITYISGLGDPQSALFTFLGIWSYLKYRQSEVRWYKSRYYLLSLVMYPLAFMTREVSVIIPGLLFLVDFFYLMINKKLSFKNSFLTSVKSLIPFVFIGIIYFILRATVLNLQNTFNIYNEETEFTGSPFIRALTFFSIVPEYLELIVFPHDLHMERDVKVITNPLNLSVIAGVSISLLSIIAAILSLKRWPIVSFGIAWFWSGMLLISNIIVPVNALMYEHWLYQPLIGVVLIIIWLILKLAKNNSLIKWSALTLFIGYLVFLFVTTWQRNYQWSDPVIFYNQTLHYSPNSFRILNNLGMSYADKGDHHNAIKTYEKAILILPSHPAPFHNLGNSYKDLKNEQLAVQNWQKAIEINPEFFWSYNAMASFYLEKKDYQKVREVYEKYLPYTEDKMGTYTVLSQVAYEQKDYSGVLKYLEEMQRLNPLSTEVRQSIEQIKTLELTTPAQP